MLGENYTKNLQDPKHSLKTFFPSRNRKIQSKCKALTKESTKTLDTKTNPSNKMENTQLLKKEIMYIFAKDEMLFMDPKQLLLHEETKWEKLEEVNKNIENMYRKTPGLPSTKLLPDTHCLPSDRVIFI